MGTYVSNLLNCSLYLSYTFSTPTPSIVVVKKKYGLCWEKFGRSVDSHQKFTMQPKAFFSEPQKAERITKEQQLRKLWKFYLTYWKMKKCPLLLSSQFDHKVTRSEDTPRKRCVTWPFGELFLCQNQNYNSFVKLLTKWTKLPYTDSQSPSCVRPVLVNNSSAFLNALAQFPMTTDAASNFIMCLPSWHHPTNYKCSKQ